MNWWLVKQEPEDYAFAQFLQEKTTTWTGVRNFQARNHLRAMQAGDDVFYYHSGASKEIVGLAKVSKTAFPDPTAEEGDWACIELKAVRTLPHPVTLAQVKAEKKLRNLALVRQSRLSVMPVSTEEATTILQLASPRPA